MPPTASTTASRSQLTVAVSSSAGETANMATSHGRRWRSESIIAADAIAKTASPSEVKL